ncbi:MAG: pyridoxamine 5'-phosphate oxidase family protein [Acidimicrobiia bacterium]|nr:pyridoxamine 5'-phosphate oxidase family protein [Acidimicrobiia bacterium]NNL12412.1 pyridoxamine 5'-phosphate oxidase [Acidimicrobiia bacterium]
MSATPMELDAARMLLGNRWAAMATLGSDGPSASMVAYATEPDLTSLLLFLSGLSEHTRNLLAEPRLSLVISEADPGNDDPQTLARVSIKGTAAKLERTDAEFEAAWRIYLDRLPDAAPRIMLADFSLFRIVLTTVRYVGGFAQAGTIPLDRLSAAAGDPEL